MDQAWIDALGERLGDRYRVQVGTERAEILYRRGKAELRPSRFALLGDGRTIEVGVDVRVPKGREAAETEPFVSALEAKTMGPRGFAREKDALAPMTSHNDEPAGSVRSLVYAARHEDAATAARHIRAIVESVDLPIILGIHEPADVEARDPRPPAPKPKRRFDEPLETLRFRLHSSLLHDLSAFVDLNTRELRVVERKLVQTAEVAEPLRLAHVARFVARGGVFSAIRRDGSEVQLAATDDPGMPATVERLAKALRVPFSPS